MTDEVASYATWQKNPEEDAAMAAVHRPYWQHFIESIPEHDLSTRTVLDFGCNRGGFLRLLYALRPFRKGVGIDIATQSIAAANDAKGDAPVQYEVATDLTPWADTFDLGFSYEVLYLLPDLERHAEQISRSLRRGGIYYAVIGAHTENPLWPKWRELIARTSNAPVYDYSPDDYIAAFAAAGFDVSLRRFGYVGFVRPSAERDYYPRITDALAYPAEHKLLFRLEKRG